MAPMTQMSSRRGYGGHKSTSGRQEFDVSCSGRRMTISDAFVPWTEHRVWASVIFGRARMCVEILRRRSAVSKLVDGTRALPLRSGE